MRKERESILQKLSLMYRGLGDTDPYEVALNAIILN
jgi:hypothetical protein